VHYFLQDSRLQSGDHLIQIGDINVGDMGSEQVANVLRKSAAHVRLIVAREVSEASKDRPPYAPIVPTAQLNDHVERLLDMLSVYPQSHDSVFPHSHDNQFSSMGRRSVELQQVSCSHFRHVLLFDKFLMLLESYIFYTVRYKISRMLLINEISGGV